MRRYLPLADSIAASLGGGATGAGIANLLDHAVPAFGGKARLFDRDFPQPFLLGWAVPSVVMPWLIGLYQVYRRFGPAGDESI